VLNDADDFLAAIVDQVGDNAASERGSTDGGSFFVTSHGAGTGEGAAHVARLGVAPRSVDQLVALATQDFIGGLVEHPAHGLVGDANNEVRVHEPSTMRGESLELFWLELWPVASGLVFREPFSQLLQLFDELGFRLPAIVHGPFSPN